MSNEIQCHFCGKTVMILSQALIKHYQGSTAIVCAGSGKSASQMAAINKTERTTSWNK
jgi:hypothetical protein